MKALSSSAKTLIILVALASIGVLARTVANRNLYSSDFLYEDEVKFSKRLDQLEQGQRQVASNEDKVNTPNIFDVESSGLFYSFDEIVEFFSGKWEITRVEDYEENVLYSKYDSDINSEYIVDFEYLGKSAIRIDEDSNQIFLISQYIEETKTVQIFKPYKDGFEVLEARKVVEKPEVLTEETLEESGPKEEKVFDKKGVKFKNSFIELKLYTAVNPSNGGKILKGEEIEGSLSVVDGNIDGLYVTLNRGRADEKRIEILSAEVKNGGQFSGRFNGEMVSGLINNNGEEGFRVRFATGPLQGCYLNFLSLDEYDKKIFEEERNAYSNDIYEEEKQVEVIEDQKRYEDKRASQAVQDAEIYERESAPYEPAYESEYEEKYEAEYEYSEEEVDAVVSENGYEF